GSPAPTWDAGGRGGDRSRTRARGLPRLPPPHSSPRQPARGAPGAGVHRAVPAAGRTPLRDRCADLVAVSAALHWFNRPKFYEEVRRVARPGAILAVWSYYRSRTAPGIDAIEIRYANEVVGAHWPPGFALNRECYRDVDLPFERLPWPELQAEAHMRLADYLAYMRTWSASQNWARTHGADPVELARPDLEQVWGDPETERVV